MGNTDKFDVIADNYDSPERMRIAEISSDALREYLDDSKNKSAIDFGCGTGLVGISLINEFKHMLFLDTSQNMISVVDRKINEAGIVNASSLCFDFETSDSETVNADYIFMAQVLLHIRDYKSVLQKLHGILNEEGHILIVDFDKNDNIASDLVHNGFDHDDLRDAMLDIGYRDIEIRTIYSGEKIFMGKDASMFILHARK